MREREASATLIFFPYFDVSGDEKYAAGRIKLDARSLYIILYLRAKTRLGRLDPHWRLMELDSIPRLQLPSALFVCFESVAIITLDLPVIEVFNPISLNFVEANGTPATWPSIMRVMTFRTVSFAFVNINARRTTPFQKYGEEPFLRGREQSNFLLYLRRI